MTGLIIAIASSYFVGSVPSALIIGWMTGGVDIRKHGSGNAGATNIYRLYGFKPYLAALFADMFKGFAAVTWLASIGAGTMSDVRIGLLCGLVAVVGHIWSVFAGFKGGKGVATAGGVFLGLAPLMGFGAILTYLVVTLISKHVSLGSMTAAVSSPFWLLASNLILSREGTRELYAITIIFAVLIPYTHRGNIERLLKGEEPETDFLSLFRKSR